MNNNSGIYNSFGQFFGSSFQFNQTDPNGFQFDSESYTPGIYGEADNNPFRTPRLDANSFFRMTETGETDSQGFGSTPMMFQTMGRILDSFSSFDQTPERPEHTTPVQPMEPVYKNVNQGLVGTSTHIVPYNALPAESAISFDTPVTQPEPSSERSTGTQNVPETTPNFVPLSFRNSSFLAMQNCYDANLGTKDLPSPQTPSWNAMDVNDMGEKLPTLANTVSEMLTSRGIKIPEKIVWIKSIESPNPCFASAREAMILDWLLENYPDLFLLIPESLLSPNFRHKQSEMIRDMFVDKVFDFVESAEL